MLFSPVKGRSHFGVETCCVLDPYACAVYRTDCIKKSEKWVSTIHHNACKEAGQRNNCLRKQVRFMKNRFLNARWLATGIYCISQFLRKVTRIRMWCRWCKQFLYNLIQMCHILCERNVMSSCDIYIMMMSFCHSWNAHNCVIWVVISRIFSAFCRVFIKHCRCVSCKTIVIQHILNYWISWYSYAWIVTLNTFQSFHIKCNLLPVRARRISIGNHSHYRQRY